MLRELGAAKNPVWKKDLEAVKDELITEGYLRVDGKIRLTQKGKQQLKEKMKRKKRIF